MLYLVLIEIDMFINAIYSETVIFIRTERAI